MAGAEMPRGDLRIRHLVVTGCVETNRKRIRSVARYVAQHAGYRRAVGAAAQEAPGNARPRLARDAFAEDCAEFAAQLAERPRLALYERWCPPAMGLQGAVPERDRCASRQPEDVIEDCAWCRYRMEIQIVEYRLWLDTRGLRSRVVGALGHDDLVAVAPEAQRAYSKPVDSGEYAAVVMQRRTRAETCVSKLPRGLGAFVRSDGGELGRIEARRAQAQRLASAPL